MLGPYRFAAKLPKLQLSWTQVGYRGNVHFLHLFPSEMHLEQENWRSHRAVPRDKGGNPFQVHGNKSWGCLSKKKTIHAKINLVHLHHLLKSHFPRENEQISQPSIWKCQKKRDCSYKHTFPGEVYPSYSQRMFTFLEKEYVKTFLSFYFITISLALRNRRSSFQTQGSAGQVKGEPHLYIQKKPQKSRELSEQTKRLN